MEDHTKAQPILAELTARIVAAYAGNNDFDHRELPGLIASVMDGLAQVSANGAEPVPEEPLVPAVSIKKSVTDDFLICLEDGKQFKSLKRHLMTHYNLTPKEYREKWGLAADYPMVARNYAAARSELAKQSGLGRKAVAETAAPDPESDAAAPKRRAPRKAGQAA